MNIVSKATRCFLCGTENTTLLQRGVRHTPKLDVHRCVGCGLVRLEPMPTEEDVAQFYTEAYRAEHEPGTDPAEAYRNELAEARERVERLKPFLTPKTRILEIGSSSGAFLDSVKSIVKEAVGVEPAQAHREWAKRELAVQIHDRLDVLRNRSFDVIALFHVLEHVRHPDEFLRELLTHLSPEGRIVVEAPNVDDALVAVYNIPAYASFYYQDAHLWYFSKETLQRTAKAAGASAEIVGIQRYDLSNHMYWMLTGKPGGKDFYRRIFPKSLDQAYGEALARSGHADTLWAVLQADVRGNNRRPN